MGDNEFNEHNKNNGRFNSENVNDEEFDNFLAQIKSEDLNINENQEKRADSIGIDYEIEEDDTYDFAYGRGMQKKSLSKMPVYVIFLVLIGLGIILFAFFMESRANDGDTEVSPQIIATETVQDEIYLLDWIYQELLDVNPFSRPGTRLETVTGVVIHNIGNPGTTAMQNRNFFNNLAVTQYTSASSHFIICLDGTILQCVPVDEIAFASNQRNDDTISIEITHPDDTGRFNEESYEAAVRLSAWLLNRYGLTSNDLIRHHDIRSTTDCPRYFVNNEGTWETFKANVQREMERQR